VPPYNHLIELGRYLHALSLLLFLVDILNWLFGSDFGVFFGCPFNDNTSALFW
jgi:hypothetical protein